MRGTEDTLELVSWIGRIIILDCSDYKSIYSAKNRCRVQEQYLICRSTIVAAIALIRNQWSTVISNSCTMRRTIPFMEIAYSKSNHNFLNHVLVLCLCTSDQIFCTSALIRLSSSASPGLRPSLNNHYLLPNLVILVDHIWLIYIYFTIQATEKYSSAMYVLVNPITISNQLQVDSWNLV